MKKKLLSSILVLTMVVCMLTGCLGQSVSITLNGDGTCSYFLKYLYEKSTYESLLTDSYSTSSSPLLSGDFAQGEETVNGMTYLTFSRTLTFSSVDALVSALTDTDKYISKLQEGSAKPELYDTETITSSPFSSVTLDANTFLAEISSGTASSLTGSSATEAGGVSADSLNGYTDVNAYYKSIGILIEYAITLPGTITESNGTISGNTASWSMDNLPADGKLIANVTGGVLSADTEAPVITGVRNNGLYKKVSSVKATDNVSLKSFTVNGVNMASTSLSFSKTGKYTLVATDYQGNSSTVKFRIDATTPKIKGVSNGQITKKKVTLRFSDKDSGVKSVKVNGKKASTKKVKLKKAGKYKVVVTDKVGNKTTVKFRIKK
jgi:hypothetical protein